jgi:hypothetical protein
MRAVCLRVCAHVGEKRWSVQFRKLPCISRPNSFQQNRARCDLGKRLGQPLLGLSKPSAKRDGSHRKDALPHSYFDWSRHAQSLTRCMARTR